MAVIGSAASILKSQSCSCQDVSSLNSPIRNPFQMKDHSQKLDQHAPGSTTQVNPKHVSKVAMSHDVSMKTKIDT